MPENFASVHDSDAPLTVDLELIARLRDDLLAAPFTGDGIQELIGPLATQALARDQIVPTAVRVDRREADPRGEGLAVATLLRLFYLGQPVPAHALDAALPTLGARGAAQLGLVASSGTSGDDVVAKVDLQPYESVDAGGAVQWWLASDQSELATGTMLRPDHVLGVGGASTTLAQITMREKVGRVLDLGTGSGVQALHASRHADRVVGTDLSRRALNYGRFNAALAGVDIEFREGSLLDPVAGEQFDLIVSNPPFVITPRSSELTDGEVASDDTMFTYRDGGREGDVLLRELMMGIGEALAPGGVAQMLGNWEHHPGIAWQERIGAWLDEANAAGPALDAWFVQRDIEDPAQYAETWLRDGGLTPDRDRKGYEAAYRAYLSDFEARGVEAVGFGYVLLRRSTAPGGPTLRRFEELQAPLAGPLGEHYARVLAAHDLLRSMSTSDLLAAHLAVAEDVTEERFSVPGGADPTVILLRQGGGFGRSVRMGTALAACVGACDGELSVGQIIPAIAHLLGVSADALAAELLADLRPLIQDGFLVVE